MFRSMLIMFLTMCIFTSVVFADTEYTQSEIRDKIEKYTKMRNGGFGLLGGGIGLLILGAFLLPAGISEVADADPYTDDNSGDAKLITGFYSLSFGVPITVAGGVLSGIGSGKMAEYKQRFRVTAGMNRISLNISF